MSDVEKTGGPGGQSGFVTITLSTEEAQTLLQALTQALHGSSSTKKPAPKAEVVVGKTGGSGGDVKGSNGKGGTNGKGTSPKNAGSPKGDVSVKGAGGGSKGGGTGKGPSPSPK